MGTRGCVGVIAQARPGHCQHGNIHRRHKSSPSSLQRKAEVWSYEASSNHWVYIRSSQDQLLPKEDSKVYVIAEKTGEAATRC
jgi:hypothetical protein